MTKSMTTFKKRCGRAQHALHKLAAALFQNLANLLQGLMHHGVRLHQRREFCGHEAAQLGDYLGQNVHQRRRLLDQGGHNGQDSHHKEDHANQGDDGRGRCARQPRVFQPIRNRIKEIGNRATQHKRQKYMPEGPEHHGADGDEHAPNLKLFSRRKGHECGLR